MIAAIVIVASAGLAVAVFFIVRFEQIHQNIKEFTMAIRPEIQTALDAVTAAANRFAALPVVPPPAAELSDEDKAALAQIATVAGSIAQPPVAS